MGSKALFILSLSFSNEYLQFKLRLSVRSLKLLSLFTQIYIFTTMQVQMGTLIIINQ